ncbi:uncharacterized protein IL334_001850 [Kwoniella shivajii]|uniref:Alpha 1,2-mannosyltransferase n=1 Tax=Kwoniella shivajii TaxID=564305 RepID=A0ABZ1CW42_9TREE|nr:hypothetical protein IL334_001850 [Kwoniella shivajii]
MPSQKPKLHIPINEKTSSFFSSPYNSKSNLSRLSPIADSPTVGSSTGTGSETDGVDSHTPLLPPTPGMVEHGSYPFPASHNGRLARLKILLRKNLFTGIMRRVMLLVILVLLSGLALHHSGASPLTLSSKGYPSSDSSRSSDGSSYINKSKKPFKVPFRLSTPSGIKHKSIYSDAKAQGKRVIDIASDSLPVSATLRERLDAWRDAPGGRGEIEGEVEHGGFVQWNLEQCDTIHEQHNTHMIQHSANVWASVNRTSLHQYRMELIDHMEGVLASGVIDNYGSGRGIVMVAGNADTLQRVKWSLGMLRDYGSELPVQIYHFPSERPGDDDPIRAELKVLGAELVEAAGQTKDAGKNKSYHLKALAVVQAPFREVLYLDSDSIPTRDPAYMFDAPNYRRLGIWATPDYWKTSANNPIWSIMGVKCRNEWEMETGQMFIDKKLHLDVFLLIKYMLENHEFWFYFSDGDKDIFRWALLALRKRWAVPGRWVGAAALPRGTASGEFCAHTMLQHDSWGEPLFVHYNLLKQIPSGVGRGFSWGRTKQLPLFNTWPATPATARLDEPEHKPGDDNKPGLGDIDCDMLADAREDGTARKEAKEMVMRRAARERGVKVKYHGGWISALCIDLDYIDPRPENRKEADYKRKAIAEEAAKLAKPEDSNGGTSDAQSEEEFVGVVYPDWEQSPIEVVQWNDDEHLRDFERKIYDLGFKPSGPGF